METSSKFESKTSGTDAATDETPTWTYPTRMCRICREDVAPTVTLYPPGLPPSFQRPIVEYKNDDEYGRLMKPCGCRGGMRYIHEYCLLRSRTEGVRPGSFWKCHECGKQFNFKRLTIQRYLGSKVVSGALTILVMLFIMFVLGFIADPIINLYMDPYDTLVGNESYWQEVDINNSGAKLPVWTQHFMKGLVSMGLVGFIKTALLNPFQWWNLRTTGWTSGRSTGTSTTGRDRAVNISWIAILIGVMSAFYFFYQGVQSIIGRALQRIGNNIVDTQLPGDDDDLKPPPGYKVPNVSAPTASDNSTPMAPTTVPAETIGQTQDTDFNNVAAEFELRNRRSRNAFENMGHHESDPGAQPFSTQLPEQSSTPTEAASEISSTESEPWSILGDAQSQSWSFRAL